MIPLAITVGLMVAAVLAVRGLVRDVRFLGEPEDEIAEDERKNR